MSNKTHRTANGQNVSIENIRLENEHVIAVGNMKVNARGDALGPGGVPGATRQQAVNEYYNLHTPVAGGKGSMAPTRPPTAPIVADVPAAEPAPVAEAIPEPAPVATTAPKTRAVRGSLATTLTNK